MGWTFCGHFYQNQRNFFQSEILGYFSTEKTIDKWRLVGSAIIDNVGLVYLDKEKSNGELVKTIGFYLLRKDRQDGFGYKDMTIFDGPAKVVEIPQKWINWFLTDNDYFKQDDDSNQYALNYIEKVKKYSSFVKNNKKIYEELLKTISNLAINQKIELIFDKISDEKGIFVRWYKNKKPIYINEQGEQYFTSFRYVKSFNVLSF